MTETVDPQADLPTGTRTNDPVPIEQKTIDIPDWMRNEQGGLKEAYAQLQEQRAEQQERQAKVEQKLIDSGYGMTQEQFDNIPPTEVKYHDSERRKEIEREGISLAQASKDYAEYREMMRLSALQEIGAAEELVNAEALQPEAPPEPTPAPEPEKPPEYTQEDLQRIEQQQRVQQELAQLEQGRQNYELALQSLIAQNAGLAQYDWADIRTNEDLAKLAQKDPARANRLNDFINRSNQVKAELARVQSERARIAEYQQQAAVQQYRENFIRYGKEQDAIFDKATPERSNPEQYKKLQMAAADALHDAGFNPEDIVASWRDGAPFSLRSAGVQRILADAARWRMAQQSKATLRDHLKHAPPVQRPGVATSMSAAQTAEAERLMERLKASGRVEDAYKAYKARKAIRG